ncbi:MULTISPECIES: hypothetical protein [unclassified Enterococcus]|uniref:hypothetical protein n=2 Tax=Enterococcus TaxID=1350 RepID=UPI002D80DE7A|nr:MULTISPECIES: hypothetical protein [unclassified Enterococcus]
MVYLYIIMFFICFGICGLLIWRYYREYLVKKVEQQPDMNALRKRKLAFFKQKMQAEHLLSLLVINGLVLVTLLFLMTVQLTERTNVRKLLEESNQLKEEVQAVRKEQAERDRMPLFAYPSTGFSFSSIDWEQLLVENDSEARFSAEHELAYQLSPFLGRSMALIFIDQPMQEISLSFVSTLMTKDDLDRWEDNWQQLLKEMEKISLLTQGTFLVQFSEDTEQSFEQIVVRDEDGEWQLLKRRLLNVETFDLSEEETNEKKTQSSHKNEKEDEVRTEQKGSVKIDE